MGLDLRILSRRLVFHGPDPSEVGNHNKLLHRIGGYIRTSTVDAFGSGRK
jgi:hypothetical protein